MQSALKRFWTKSIARQLMLGIALVHAVLMSIFIVDLTQREESFLIDLSHKQASGLAKTLATNATSWVLAQDFLGMEEVIASQGGFPGLEYAMLVDTRGKVLAYTDIRQVGKYIADDISKTLLSAEPVLCTLVDNSRLIDIAAPIAANNQLIGWARVGISREGIIHNIQHVIQNGLIYAFTAILVGTIFAWFMSRGLTTDIRKLVSQAKRLQQGEKDINFLLERKDELGEMAENFQKLNETLFIQLESLQQEIHAKENAIEKRNVTEEKLRKAINIIDNSYAVVFRWRNETGWPVEYVSKNVIDIFGYSAETFLSGEISYADLIHSEDLGRVAKEVRQYSDEKDMQSFVHEPYRIIAHNGSIRWLEDKTNIIRDDNGNVTHFEGVIQDISSRITAKERAAAMEAMLRQAQKMEAIGTLAGGIAHDFNNILSPILGYSEMALETIPPGTQTAQDIKEVLTAANRAKELVKQILSFSRQADQELRPLKSQLVIKEALKLLRASIPTTIEIVQDINMECQPVLADPTQIHQIIMNLCTNAYHAMREAGGVLTVSLTPMEFNSEDLHTKSALSPGKYVYLEVSDTGQGMEPIILERIFEPYFTTKCAKEGTGLGLSVVHGIIKNLNGDITVCSEPGKGTRFQVYLPTIEQELEKLTDKETTRIILTGNERILVVDDDEEIVRMVWQMLSNLGYKVTTSTSSEDALQLFQTQPNDFQLIITDMTMPGLLGTVLAQKILAIRPEIPIILCTGFSELISEEEAKALGIREFLMKPVISRKLAQVVRKALDGTGKGVEPL